MSPDGAPAPTPSVDVPLRLVRRGGEQAVLVPRWTRAARAGRWVLAALTVVGVGLGTYLYVGTDHEWGFLPIGVGLVFLATLVRDALRQPYDGGVWLSPTALSHQWGHRRWSLAWDDVLGAVAREDGDVEVRSRRSGEDRVVSAHLLVVGADTLVDLVEAYAAHPDRRPQLASQAGLLEAETLRRARLGTFRVVVRHQVVITRAQQQAVFATLWGAITLLALLGRHTQVSRTDLEDVVRGRLVSSGAGVSAVDCDGAVRKQAGETQTCTATVDGSSLRLRVTVTRVDGDRVSYRVAPR